MANEQNLRPIKLTHEEAMENGRKGGKASGKARRERRALRELMEMRLEGSVEYKGEVVTRKDVMAARAIDMLTDPDARDKMSASEFVRAFEMVRDTLGEKPSEKVEVATADQAKLAEFLDYIEQDHGNEKKED